jgi:hypothetical protein
MKDNIIVDLRSLLEDTKEDVRWFFRGCEYKNTSFKGALKFLINLWWDDQESFKLILNTFLPSYFNENTLEVLKKLSNFEFLLENKMSPDAVKFFKALQIATCKDSNFSFDDDISLHLVFDDERVKDTITRSLLNIQKQNLDIFAPPDFKNNIDIYLTPLILFCIEKSTLTYNVENLCCDGGNFYSRSVNWFYYSKKVRHDIDINTPRDLKIPIVSYGNFLSYIDVEGVETVMSGLYAPLGTPYLFVEMDHRMSSIRFSGDIGGKFISIHDFKYLTAHILMQQLGPITSMKPDEAFMLLCGDHQVYRHCTTQETQELINLFRGLLRKITEGPRVVRT